MAYSSIGTALWSLVLAGAGYLLEGQYDKVSGWMDPVAKLVIAAIAAWYAYRVATFRPQEQN